ncbi:MAG: formate--tetrahydrofolate ligase [Actinobacteria bacterium RBG_16_64_13]|nr:MAG: formate--tetrahydrofolate ligase [Actinobacteria bacterium RBG_16_64_13]
MKSDIEIAREAHMIPVTEIAAGLGLDHDDLDAFGRYKAKIHLDVLDRLRDRPDGKLVLCTAITPTPAGEGKTTTNVGLSMGLSKMGKKAVCTLREPSLGPCFGIKGGAAGGGYAQVIPMEDINLHFTGDLHAISTAHNLCAAVLDNHLFQGNELGVDPANVSWPRVVDLNDRALRQITIGQGGEGVERRTRYDITVASEVMAILCLATDIDDLKARLERIVLGPTLSGGSVTAKDIKVSGSMAVLLKDALMPNLVQTLENTPAIIHGGPFANIAHGCNSVQATRMALKLGEYCITEAGFGADLGAEKFFDIKCRYAGLVPDCVVLVATIRALKMHGGVPFAELKKENLPALSAGLENLEKHLENMQLFGPPVVVAINRFPDDTDAEVALLRERVGAMGANVVLSDVWALGGEGGIELAEEVVRLCEGKPKPPFRFLYDLESPLTAKIEAVATRIYGADGVDYTEPAKAAIERFTERGYGRLPVCMAKTQASLTDDKTKVGRPRDWRLTVREVRLSAGAGMIVPVCGQMMTMPGLPKHPAAEQIDLVDGHIEGLF